MQEWTRKAVASVLVHPEQWYTLSLLPLLVEAELGEAKTNAPAKGIIPLVVEVSKPKPEMLQSSQRPVALHLCRETRRNQQF